jgi:hypothetical protein
MKYDVKLLRTIAIEKYGPSVIAPLSDDEVSEKILKEYTIVKDINNKKTYLISNHFLKESIILEDK